MRVSSDRLIGEPMYLWAMGCTTRVSSVVLSGGRRESSWPAARNTPLTML